MPRREWSCHREGMADMMTAIHIGMAWITIGGICYLIAFLLIL